MVWYSHLFKNIPEFVVIHTVKGIDIIKAEVDVYLELSWFFYDPMDHPESKSIMNSTFSANNITEERWVENDEGDKYTWVAKHSYSYNDMYPTVQRISEQYDGGDTCYEVYYYEYE